ncbi:MAG TPA: DUF2530 domain-containing protein [Pseudonocardiaceae bacterium]|nr:DUF2530 domain-containing protein [Pseudonocardiaceae bacterium]
MSNQVIPGRQLARNALACPVPPPPPGLPRRLADPRPAVGVGTLGWFAAAMVLLLTGGPPAWIWACLTGGLLGLIGFAMIHWQRSAARRGSRGAQRDVL